MSGVVGVFALGGSWLPCEPKICQMAKAIAKEIDHHIPFSDHRLRFEAMINPGLEQSSFECAETGCTTWLFGHLTNQVLLESRIGIDTATNRAAKLSPAELLARLYRRKGLLAIPMLQGAFAALIWDPREHRFVLLRDPLGLKSLYYSQDGDHLWFASAQDAFAFESSAIDFSSVHRLILTGATKQGKTLIDKVEAVQPGEFILAERGRVQRSRYWQFLYEPQDQQVSSSLALQLALSQSVDATLNRLQRQKMYVERCNDQSSVLNLLLNIQSRYPYEQHADVRISFRDLVQQWGQPFGHLAELANAMTLAAAEPGQAFILPTGQDILFGQHPCFRKLRWQQRLAQSTQESNNLLQQDKAYCNQQFSVLSPIIADYTTTKQYFSMDFLVEIEQSGILLEQDFAPEWHEWTSFAQLQSALVQWHLQSLLANISKIALTRSVSVEQPFVDLAFIEVLLTQNPCQHMTGVVGGQSLEQIFGPIRQDHYAQDLDPTITFTSKNKSTQRDVSEIKAYYWAALLAECIDILHQQSSCTVLNQPAVLQLIKRCQEQKQNASPRDIRALVFMASLLVWLGYE